MAVRAEEVVAVEIIKPRNDIRNYRRIVLPNKLQVLIISDPETDKCAASMDVRVGCFSNPEGLEGLAHFLEHMLFYASEKYPEEDSYRSYISEHGGFTNAFTSKENTNYNFDVNADSFEEALDRFSQFFLKPLMSADATMRELKAVDSENTMNLLSDDRRMIQLEKHLSSRDHPYHKFSTGNWETLEIRPKERGVDTRKELLRFYKEYYSANIMNLVIYTRDGLDKAESLVWSKFQDIRNTDRNFITFAGQPCDSDNLQILVKTVPIKQGHKLQFVWPVTPGILHYKEGRSEYLSHLIGHEGEGSLFYALKKLGWATSLYVHKPDLSCEYAFFKVTIVLTDAGHEHFEDITALMFKYIRLLQQSGPCQWIFEELAAISETSFHYQDKIRPRNYVIDVACNMQFYPPQDWLVRLSLVSKFSPGVIQSALDELSPYKVRIFWSSTKFEGLTELTEPWYGTAYSKEQLPGFTIQQWIERAPDVELHLPAPNVFIPTDLSLKAVPDQMKVAVFLRKSPYSRLWYKPDTTFCTPKSYVKIDFNCPFSSSSPEAKVLTGLFTRLLMDYLNEYAYDAQVAGLRYGVYNTDYGFQVVVVGYNHKLNILLENLIQRIASFEVKHERFYVIKESITKMYQNLKFQQPCQQAMYNCSLILQDKKWPWTDELEVLPRLNADDLVKFFPLIMSKVFMECYVAGNVDPSEAQSMIQKAEDVLFKGSNPLSEALFASECMANRIVKLEKGKKHVHYAEVLNPSDENSALVHYIQVHQDDFKMNVKLQLFTLIAKQPAFQQLRSVEQLGYITKLRERNDSGIYGIQFCIQSNVKDPGYIELRVESFLKMFECKLYAMPIDEFKSKVNALIDMKVEKHKNLQEESMYYWREISDGTLRFNRKEYEVDALKQLTKKELIDFFDEYIKVGAPRKKSLSIRVYGKKHTPEYKEDSSPHAVESDVVQIEHICSFRRSRPLYGLLEYKTRISTAKNVSNDDVY